MMKIDTKAIDAQIKKLEELKRFMGDPATAPFIEQFISSNGMEHPASPNTAATPTPFSVAQATHRGQLTGAVAEVCRSMTENFNSKEVIKRLRQMGFTFHAKNTGVAVNTVLKRLVKRGTLELVKKASGQRPATYRIPQRFPREMKGTAA
jgi:hypothetical protein